ncbi:hypothetical protein AB0L40_13070 [Patulibacter sp. NPDC049589]|uniref:hypothetical protein n=1 Tax=Patulibacter sp. NPDC049589 TaxID=3154731 RepID=UPI00343D1D5C
MTPPPASTPIELPEGIVALGPDACSAVEALVLAAERRQEAEVQAALEHGLRVVPRPLRGITRRVLVG